MYTLPDASRDSKRSLSGYRFRKFAKTKTFLVLAILALPFMAIANVAKKPEAVSILAVIGLTTLTTVYA